MLVKNQKIKMNWNPSNKKHYESKGYPYTKMDDEFEVKVEDLTPQSQKYVLVRCDYCGIPFMRKYSDYNTRKEKCEIEDKDCCDDCLIFKRQQNMLGKYNPNNVSQIIGFEDLIGMKFNHLTVISLVPNKTNKHKDRYWLCECDCENKTRKEIAEPVLIKGKTRSCGCLYDKKTTEQYKLELEEINKERDTNTKLKDGVKYINNNTKIIHICTCGKEWDTTPGSILSGSKTCGLCYTFAEFGIDNLGKDFLEKYWDYEKNNELGFDPWKITYKSNTKKVWIKCQEKDYHESYDVRCADFVNNDRCPYCSSNKVHSLDSLGSLYPKSLEVWSDKNEKSPYEYAPWSNEDVYWKCPNGKHEDYPRKISVSNRSNFKCPECSLELRESILATTLKQVLKHEYPDTKWEYDAGFRTPKNWISKYDIFVSELNNLLIECQSWFHDNPEKQEIDRLKKEYALNNGYNYIAIDNRDYTPLQAIQLFFPKIREIPDYVDLLKDTIINWSLEKAQELLDEGYTHQEVVDILGIKYGALAYYIRKKILIKPENYKIIKPNLHKKIVSLNIKDNKLVKIYNSIKEASIDIKGNDHSCISCALVKSIKSCYGFKWMYYDDYLYNQSVNQQQKMSGGDVVV